MARTGRPKLAFDQKTFEMLCRLQCTRDEIANAMEISADTLERRVKALYKTTFAAVFEVKRLGGFVSLRRAQFRMAEDNPTMAIWLGKQLLGQRDQHFNVNLDLATLTDEQLERIAAGEDPQSVAASSSGGTRETTPDITSDTIQ